VDLVAKLLIPALVIFMMTVVGMELTVADFKRALRHPLVVAVVVAGQVLLLPVVAAALVWLLSADPTLAAGLILVSTCPVAAISNYYALLARGNIGLAVTLTAVSSVAAAATTPLVASAAFALLLQQGIEVTLPVTATARQLVAALVLPIVIGMAVRHLAPDWTARHRTLLQRFSLVALSALILVVLVDQAATIRAGLGPLVLAAALFTVAALAMGYVLSALIAERQADRSCIAISTATRNLSIAILIAANVLGRLDYVAFAAVFFLTQLALLLPLLYRLRARKMEPETGAVDPGT
jgi:BASS family bile acid:Na+ symporter